MRGLGSPLFRHLPPIGQAKLGHFPQKCRRFRANGLLTINYMRHAVAKFCNMLGVQNLYSNARVVFRMLQ